MGNANLNPRTEAKVDTKNPDRGPLLIIEGEKDHTVPWAIANAAYKRQRRNPGVTEIVKLPNRGHSLTIDHGWREVAQTALDFVQRFTSSDHKTTSVPKARDASANSGLASGESVAGTERGSAT
jgi:alpha-beta hydrolase superfamily lysophospholipase